MEKRLYKSNKNKMLDGVCGGIAEYFNIDPTLVRLGAVVLACGVGSGIQCVTDGNPFLKCSKYGLSLNLSAGTNLQT